MLQGLERRLASVRMALARLLVPVRPEHEDHARLGPVLDVQTERGEGLVQARIPSLCGSPLRNGQDAWQRHQLVEVRTLFNGG